MERPPGCRVRVEGSGVSTSLLDGEVGERLKREDEKEGVSTTRDGERKSGRERGETLNDEKKTRLTQSSFFSPFSLKGFTSPLCFSPHCSIGTTVISLCRPVLLRLKIGINSACGSGFVPLVVPCRGMMSGWLQRSMF